jgi:hypothetical protein
MDAFGFRPLRMAVGSCYTASVVTLLLHRLGLVLGPTRHEIGNLRLVLDVL